MEEKSANSAIAIDWERFREIAFRFVTGVGLVVGWLVLINLTLGVLVIAGIMVSKLSLAWLLAVAVLTPMAAFVWWLCFHVALDGLSDIGIQLKGIWSWLVIPVAPLLAVITFFVIYMAGFGNFVSGRVSIGFSFALGLVILLTVSALSFALLR